MPYSRDISKIEGCIRTISEDSKAAKHMLEEQRAKNSMYLDESKHRAMQTDVKLKKAEETNQQLAKELEELKAKYESLDASSPVKKKKQAMDLINDLDRVFEEDRTFIGGQNMNMTAFGHDLFGSDADPTQEYEFKIKVMEHDLQSIQSENNSLVQAVLKLRQEYREKKNMHDEVSMKLINQEMTELKREINNADERFNRLTQEINEVKQRLEKMGTSSSRALPIESAESLKLTIEQLEQSNKVAIIELCDLKDRNRSKQQQVEIEKAKRASERQAVLEQMEKESLMVGELRNRILELNTTVKQLESRISKERNDTSVISKAEGAKLSKDHLKSLRQTNERLMGEIIRLNGIIKEQKAAEQSRMNQSLSISAINFNEQSFDQTFLSKFK